MKYATVKAAKKDKRSKTSDELDVACALKLIITSKFDEAAKFVTDKPWISGLICNGVEGQWVRNGKEPLFIVAVQTCNIDLIKAFVNAGAPLEMPDENGRTAIMIAVDQSLNSSDVNGFLLLDFLASKGASLKRVDKNYDNIFTSGSPFLSLSLTETAIKQGLQLDAPVGTSSEPLITAMCQCLTLSDFEAEENFKNVLKLVIDSSTNLNPVVSSINHFPLVAALNTEHCDVAQALLDRGANPRYRSPDGKSIFFGALNPKMVNLAFSVVPDLLDSPDQDGSTPLMHAMSYMHQTKFKEKAIESIKALILAGADLDAIDHRGPSVSRSARQQILEKPKTELAIFMRSIDRLKAAREALTEINSGSPLNTFALQGSRIQRQRVDL